MTKSATAARTFGPADPAAEMRQAVERLALLPQTPLAAAMTRVLQAAATEAAEAEPTDSSSPRPPANDRPSWVAARKLAQVVLHDRSPRNDRLNGNPADETATADHTTVGSNPTSTNALTGHTACYVEAPAVYGGTQPGVFLAGGISGCPNWHADAVEALAGLPIAVFNPNRASFPIADPNGAGEQIRWEFAHLMLAQVILFWFPDSGPVPQPIALYELGRYAALGRTIVVGADQHYVRRDDVVIQLGLSHPELHVHDSLDATCNEAARLLQAAGATLSAGA